MSISITCNCGQDFELPDELAGKSARCHNCQEILLVPSTASSIDQVVKTEESTKTEEGAGSSVADPSEQDVSNAGQELPAAGVDAPLAQPPADELPQAVFSQPDSPSAQEAPVDVPGEQVQNGQLPTAQLPVAQMPAAHLPSAQLPVAQLSPFAQASEVGSALGPAGMQQQDVVENQFVQTPSSKSRSLLIWVGVIVAISVVGVGGYVGWASGMFTTVASGPKSPKELGYEKASVNRSEDFRQSQNPNGGIGTRPDDLFRERGSDRVKIEGSVATLGGELTSSNASPPKLAISRNGRFVALSEGRPSEIEESGAQLALIDLETPDVIKIVEGLENGTVTNISNDGAKVVFREDPSLEGSVAGQLQQQPLSICEVATADRYVTLNGFSGKSEFSDNSLQVILDDRKDSFVFNANGDGMQWSKHHSALAKNGRVRWSGDLKYGYYFSDDKIHQFNEMNATSGILMETSVGDSPLLKASFSSNCEFFLAMTEKELQIYDLSKKEMVKSIKLELATANNVAEISNNGRIIALIRMSNDGNRQVGEEIVIVDTESEEVIETLSTGTSFEDLRLSGDGGTLTSVQTKLNGDYHVAVWKLDIDNLPDQSNSIETTFVDEVPEDKRLEEDLQLRFDSRFSIQGSKFPKPGTSVIDKFMKGYTPVAMKGDSGSSSSNTANLKLADADLNNEFANLVERTDLPGVDYGALFVSDDGNVVAAGPSSASIENRAIAIWDRNTKKLDEITALKNSKILSLSHDGSRVALEYSRFMRNGPDGNGLRVYDIGKRKLLSRSSRVAGNTGYFSDDGKKLMTFQFANGRIWDAEAGKVTDSILARQLPIQVLGVSDDLTKVYGFNLDGKFIAFDAKKEKQISSWGTAEFKFDNDTIAAFSEASSRLIFAEGETLYLADTTQKKQLAELKLDPNESVDAIALSPDGQIAVATVLKGDEMQVRLIDLQDDQLGRGRDLPVSNGSVCLDIAFSLESKMLYALVSPSSNEDSAKSIVVWKLNTN